MGHNFPTFPQVGDSFISHTERRYRTADGTGYALHRYSQRMVVTEVDAQGYKAVVTDLLAETNRPEWATSDLTVGSCSALLFTWERYADRGEYTDWASARPIAEVLAEAVSR